MKWVLHRYSGKRHREYRVGADNYYANVVIEPHGTGVRLRLHVVLYRGGTGDCSYVGHYRDKAVAKAMARSLLRAHGRAARVAAVV